MEDRPGVAVAMLASCKLAEVLGGLWGDVVVQLEDDAACRCAAD